MPLIETVSLATQAKKSLASREKALFCPKVVFTRLPLLCGFRDFYDFHNSLVGSERQRL